MQQNFRQFIEANSPDGGFLQSDIWRSFQESVGHKTFHHEGDGFWANVIEHELPIVGKYFYVPRGPIFENPNDKIQISKACKELIELSKKNKAGWVRIDLADEDLLKVIKNNTKSKIVKAPHDMQPREIFVIDITKPEEQLLAEMKSKTRYNIRLAEKKEVRIKKQEVRSEYIEDFLSLTKVMAKRQGITAHPESYYRKMLEAIPGDILKLYVAEYEGKIIAANLVVFYGNACTYLHGASDDKYKNVMAPHLLQWRQIQDAKAAGCGKYDFGGISTNDKFYETTNKWKGITRFKLGFSPKTEPTRFPGSYDIIIDRKAYTVYRLIQRVKSFFM